MANWLYGDIEIMRLDDGSWRVTYLRHESGANPDTGDSFRRSSRAR